MSSPAGLATKTRVFEDSKICLQPALLSQIDQAAERQGLDRSSFIRLCCSKALAFALFERHRHESALRDFELLSESLEVENVEEIRASIQQQPRNTTSSSRSAAIARSACAGCLRRLVRELNNNEDFRGAVLALLQKSMRHGASAAVGGVAVYTAQQLEYHP